MYSSEIEEFLKERNNVVTAEECNVLMDVNRNPQITHMAFYSADNRFVIRTDDNFTFVFWVKHD